MIEIVLVTALVAKEIPHQEECKPLPKYCIPWEPHTHQHQRNTPIGRDRVEIAPISTSAVSMPMLGEILSTWTDNYRSRS